MKHRLTGDFTTIHHDTGSFFVHAGFLRNYWNPGHHISHKFAVFVIQFHQRGNMLQGDEEHMMGSLGVNVPESQYLIVFIDDISRNLTADNFAEYTVQSYSPFKTDSLPVIIYPHKVKNLVDRQFSLGTKKH